MDQIAINLLTVQNQLKIYHFQTPIYARHISSDKLFNSMNIKIDHFMEVLQGSRNSRLVLGDNYSNIPVRNMDNGKIIGFLNLFKDWLMTGLPTLLYEKETDLFNIRDEILADVNQTLYLFTFS